MSSTPIGRGWIVFSSDNKRVGDVTEVHPHYLLVSRGVILIKDMYLPLGTVARTEGTTVILTVSYDVLRKMDLAHEPPPLPVPEPEPIQDPAPTGYDADLYSSEVGAEAEAEPLAFPGTWDATVPEYEETPSYTRPLPNGLVEVEHALNLAFHDLGYGSPLLFLQGWPFDSTIWEPLPAILAADHRVVLYDMRGSGDSDRPWDYYSLDTLVHDLHRVVIEQSLRDVTLVAWSSAGSVALEYAREHPGRIERVILLSPLLLQWLGSEDVETWLGRRPDLDQATQEAWAADLINDRPALFERLVDWLTDTPLSSPRRRWLWSRLMHGAPHAQGKVFDVMRSHDPTGLLGDVKVPVTILTGDRDRLAPPALAERMASQLPRSQVIMLENCGHACFIDQRDLVVRAILDLVDVHIETPEQQAEVDPFLESEPDADAESVDDPETGHEPDPGGLLSTDAERAIVLDQ